MHTNAHDQMTSCIADTVVGLAIGTVQPLHHDIVYTQMSIANVTTVCFSKRTPKQCLDGKAIEYEKVPPKTSMR